MAAPYNLEIIEDCTTCAWKSEEAFCDLPAAVLKPFEAAKYTSTYPAGSVLFVDGQTPRGVYLLCKGRVKVAMTSKDGKSIILRIVESGELIGLNSVITGKSYEFTAETLEPCQVNFLHRDAFLKLMHEHHEVLTNVTEQLSSDYGAACVQIRSLALCRTAEEKVARFLLDWSAKGRETNQGIRMNLPLTHEEIAQIIGVSRETVTRTLSELKSKSLITMKGSLIVIRSKPDLEALTAD